VNCKESCVNGCILGDVCPHIEHAKKAIEFINTTSLEDILKIADKKNFQDEEGTLNVDYPCFPKKCNSFSGCNLPNCPYSDTFWAG